MFINPPKFRIRMYLLFILMVGTFVALIMRLWSLQIDQHDKFVNKVPAGSEKTVRLPGFRGEIFDRNGIKLVGNEPTYDIVLDLKAIEKAYLEKERKENVGKKGSIHIPTYEYKVKVTGSAELYEMKTATDIAAICDEMVMPNLEAWGLYQPYSAEAMRLHLRSTSGAVPWTYRRDLEFTDYAFIAEHNILLPGVSVGQRARRIYPYESMLSHVLGYVRGFDVKLVAAEELKKWNFYVGDDTGVTGIEHTMNEVLQGKPGVRRMQVNERGKMLGEIGSEEPRKGSDVFLTIDARIQFIAEQAMREAGVGRAAAVVMDPNNGDMLAMVSLPSYNPNKFVPSIKEEDFAVYNQNDANPLLNRAVQSYLPGSTFKIPVALAGIPFKLLDKRYNCRGYQTYGKSTVNCWIGNRGGSHGTLNMVGAIRNSCNCYFMQYGNATKIENIKKMGELMGLGKVSGSQIFDEDTGRVPDPEWLHLARPTEVWTNVRTAFTSIGQDLTEATPLQMCSVTATVANGGKVWKPRIIHRVRDSTGSEDAGYEPKLRENLLDHGITAKDMEQVRKGMWEVVQAPGGTGKNARIAGVEVAGKTGTAQFKFKNKVDDRVWFICFAPYKEPKFAVCVIVEGGKSGGGVSAPIAQRILQQSLALSQGYTVDPQRMPEAAGHTNFMETTRFSTVLDLGLNEDDDGSAAPAKNVDRDDRKKNKKNAGDIEKKPDRLAPTGRPTTEIKRTPNKTAPGSTPPRTPPANRPRANLRAG